MSLPPGTRLGPYEILSPLGAGGMGEVYRARDTRLDRAVAVKVLPENASARAGFRERFEREALAVSSLTHPHICTLHDVGRESGIDFLVMELLDGETLASRLSRGPMPIDEAVGRAAEIADALRYAHQHGVIHRDLKPANIMLTASGSKLLDFGLAKMPERLHPPDARGGSEMRTLPGDLTEAGGIVGTTAYLSPEQARGREVDARTDIWSFGCLFFEMLTARRAFSGDTASDVLAAILTREPDFSVLPPAVPEPLARLLRGCLEKDVTRRIGDMTQVLKVLNEAPSGRASTSKLPRWMLGAVGAILITLTILYVVRRPERPEQASPAPPPTLTQVTFNEGIEQFPAWSPDGQSLAYSQETGPVRKIFVKRPGENDEKQLTTGDADDIQPSWSPDGRTLLFVRAREGGHKLEPDDVFGQYAGGDIWSIDIGAGSQTRLLERAANPSYAPDGQRFAVDAPWAGPRRIWVVDALGRNPQQVTTDDSEAIEHLRPRWSADGTRIVFQNVERTRLDVRVVDLATKSLINVTNDPERDINPVWSPAGAAIYFTSDRGGGLNIWSVPVDKVGKPTGPLRQLTTGAGQDVELAFSKQGRLAFSTLRQNADLWRLPVSPETGRPVGQPAQVVATTREDSRGSWSPDGSSIAFNSDRSGDMNIWLLSQATGQARPLTRGRGGDFQPNWSPDGRHLVFFSSRSGNVDIWNVEVASGALTRLTQDAGIDVNPFYAPDGRRIAYQSDRGGRLEVWIMNADGSEPRRLTQVGVMGHFLRWTRAGDGILFRCPCGGVPAVMIVSVDSGELRPLPKIAGGAHLSFSPDFSLLMDCVGHKSLWVSPILPGEASKVFEFDDADARIDYPVWAPDGRSVLFDRFRPEGGDLWIMEKVE